MGAQRRILTQPSLFVLHPFSCKQPSLTDVLEPSDLRSEAEVAGNFLSEIVSTPGLAHWVVGGLPGAWVFL